MWSIANAVTVFFDGMIGIFAGMHPLAGLCAVSILTGGVMLVVWKFTSNQKAIARAKKRIGAYILEIRLFQDDLRLQFAAQRKALTANLRYMSHAIPPLLVVLIPVVIILVQLDVRYARRPLLPGESTLLKVKLTESVDPSELAFDPPAGLVLETLPLRIEREHEVDWRIRAESEGDYDLSFSVGGAPATKRLVVGDKLSKLAQEREQTSILGVWLAPAEAPLPDGSPIRSIEFSYPDRDLSLWGVGLHWLLVFFVVSVAFGFAIKGLVGVEV